MAAETNASTSGSSSTRSVGAPVIADTGLIVMLPHNLYQMSRRTSADTVTSKPAARSVSASARTRADSPPAGSPTIRPWPILCSTSPGSEVDVLACTTQPITCSNGQRGADHAARVDAGQRPALERAHAAAEPPRHAVHRRQHQRVRGQQRRDRRRHLGQRLALDGEHHKVLRAELCRVLLRVRRRAEQRAPLAQAPAVLAQGRQRRAARQRADLVRAAERQPRADEAADRTGADHTDLHALTLSARHPPGRQYCAAVMAGWKSRVHGA